MTRQKVFLIFPVLASIIIFSCGSVSPQKAHKVFPRELALAQGASIEGEEFDDIYSGKAITFQTDVWWDGYRPKDRYHFALEVEYLDNFSLPAIALVYSQLDISVHYSELHRFGGLGDNQWKTARIPCESGFLALHEPDSTARFRLISQDGMLNVRRVTLLEGKADDEALYNAQTREWVERVQHRSKISESYFKLVQTPVIPQEMSQSAIVPYSRSWMEPLMTIAAPQAGEVVDTLFARMSLNEWEPVQLGIYANGQDLKDVTVKVGDLRAADGSIVAKCNVRVAEYSLVRTRDGDIPVRPFPQRLWPSYSFDVSGGRSHSVWLEINTADVGSSTAGEYITEVSVSAGNAPSVTVQLKVEILPIRLLTMNEAGLTLGNCTRGLLPFHEIELLGRYNHNSIIPWYFSARPELHGTGDGGFEIDWRSFDLFMQACRHNAINYIFWFLGENPFGFPGTMKLEQTLAQDVLGLDKRETDALIWEKPDSVHQKLRPLVVEWASKVRAHAADNNWPTLNVTPFDEPAKWVQTAKRWEQMRGHVETLSFIKPHFIHLRNLLKEGNSDFIISGDIHHYKGGIDFLPYLDLFCTNATHENLDMPRQVKEAGVELWEYSGAGDAGLPGRARYTFGYYFAANGSVGSLVWAYNWGKRFDTLDGSSWVCVWNTPFDIIPTPFMMGISEAWDERRLLETLKSEASARNVDIDGFLSTLFAEVHDSMGLRGQSTVTDFWFAAQDNNKMDQWRRRIEDKLLEIITN
ncbi:hypothetical protein ACFL4X_01930 [Gemmatimonadota bacterium]